MSTPNVLRVSIYLDSDCSDPTEDESQWKIYTFKGFGHHLITDVSLDLFFDDDDVINPAIADKLERGYAFKVRYREHGICDYGLCDSSEDGFIVWEHPEGDIGGETIEDRRKDAESFLEEYTRWANGECFGYRVDQIKSVAPDYDPEDDSHNGAFWEEVDSCWGLIGAEYLIETVQRTISEYPGAKIIYKGDAAHIMR